jgi:hypothetical protein
MTIEVLFNFVQKLIFLLGVTALALAFMYMYSAETDKRAE